jgi:putative component of membrane protein insertase Oxa1/YidC/SpoIIIJ protein YidD
VRAYQLLISPMLGAPAVSSPPVPLTLCRRCEQHGAAGGSYLAVRRIARCQPWCEVGTTRSLQKAPAVYPVALPFLDKEVFMNDIRRTILWVIFGFSMVMLWDQWQVHNGNKATFFPSPAKTAASAAPASASAVPAASGVPQSNAVAATAREHTCRSHCRRPGHSA